MPMRLVELLKDIAEVDDDRIIEGLALDSRAVVDGDLFFAVAGAKQHGLMHARQAAERGARAIVFDPIGSEALVTETISHASKLPLIAVDRLSQKLSEIAARFYRRPSHLLNVIGITGTNGKTSCSQFLAQMLEDCGYIGTLGWGGWNNSFATINTTPDAIAVQRILAEFVKANKQSVAMEVSSHGLDQGRVNAVEFTGAVFTNLSRDHLDYHETLENYFKAKLKLFQNIGLNFAVVNLDDSFSGRVIDAIAHSVPVWGFTSQGKRLDPVENVVAENIAHNEHGIEFDVTWQNQHEHAFIPVFGDFNIENVLAILTVMLAMGLPLGVSVKKLNNINAVKGRMERFGSDCDPLIFVDYAHTPDALKKVLSSLKKHCRKELWVVFGCGGDRDAGKRPLMGACAEQLADHVILTDDNPRTENSMAIINDILSGCRSTKIEVIQNRELAIQKALTAAAAEDCVVIAGKGHEDYQEIAGIRYPFSDKLVVEKALSMRTATV